MKQTRQFKKNILILITIVLPGIFGLFWACRGQPNTEDLRVLNEIGREFETRYELSLYDDLYIIVKAIDGNRISYEDMKEIYKKFIFTDFDKRIKRKTFYVYLNAYSSNNDFEYQIYFDRKKNRFVKGNADFY